MSLNKRKTKRWFRVLHRDIGYFAVGMTLVYALSGFFLSHKNIFSATKTEKVNLVFPKNLNGEAFSDYWNSNTSVTLNHYKENDKTIRIYIDGGVGYYNKSDGLTTYELYRKRPFIGFVNQLHYNQKKGWKYIANTYVLILIFLAISGLFMTSGKNGFLKRGIWLMIFGFVLVVMFILI